MAKKRKKKAAKHSKKEPENARATRDQLTGYSEIMPDGKSRTVVGYDLAFQPPLPRGALRANPSAQTLGPWIRPRYYYLDQEQKCWKCKTEFTFSAREQKLWYEDYGLSLEAVPDCCLACRRIKRFERSLRDEHQAAIEAADASPKDSRARLREAEARVRYFGQSKTGNLALAIAASRAAKKFHRGDTPLWIASLWEGWAQAQSGRNDVAKALLQEFADNASKKSVSSVAKETKALGRHLKSGNEENLNQALLERTIKLLSKKGAEEKEAALEAKLLAAEQRKLIDNALHGRATVADMDALLNINLPMEGADYKEWQAAANNALVNKLDSSDPAHLMAWAEKLVVHAKQHIYLPHNVACAFALAGAPDDGYEMCELAIEHGYPDAYQLPWDKQLASIQTRLTTLVKKRPGWRTKPAPPPRYGYQVVTDRASIGDHSVPKLLDELAHFLRYTTQGTVGRVAFAYYPITRKDVSETVRKQGFRFITLGEDTDICLFRFENIEPVVLLGGKEEPRLLGNSLNNFLLDWADAKTGLSQLDQLHEDADSRHRQFKRWLEFLGVTRTTDDITVDLKKLFAPS